MSLGWRVVGRALLASSSLVLIQAWLDVQQHPDVASGTSTQVLLLLVAMACVWSTYWLVTAGQASVALSIAAVGLLAALASSTLLLLPARYFGLLIFAAVLAGGALPKRLAVRAVAALTVLTVGLGLARSLGPASIAIDALEVGVTGAGAVAVGFFWPPTASSVMLVTRSRGSQSRRSAIASPATSTTTLVSVCRSSSSRASWSGSICPMAPRSGFARMPTTS